MLSILIPTYNYDCYALVKSLQEQGEALSEPYEIVVADDASTQFKDKNGAINQLKNCRYILRPQNSGRAAIRNFLAQQAHYPWLLFIDCDAAVTSSIFLQNYLQVLSQADVICGGLRHQDVMPSPNVSLRFRYEKKADSRRSAHERSLHPYAQFTPFNFLIKKELFSSIRFNESCREYGHEDTLFGVELHHRHVSILHIENPLIHLGLEDNLVFLEKTRAALRNLKGMEKQMAGNSLLLVHYFKLRRWKLVSLIAALYRLSEKRLLTNLTGPKPNLLMFSFYKLGYYCTLAPLQLKQR